MPGGDSLGRRELTPEVLARWIPALCEAGALWRFYKTAPSLVVQAEMVHHVYPVKTHPAWALSEFVTTPEGKRVRNLVPLCHDCHDRAHQRMGYRPSPLSAPPLTPERW